MEYIRYFSMETSVELAEKYGAFPAIKGSIYDLNIQWEVPTPQPLYAQLETSLH